MDIIVALKELINTLDFAHIEEGWYKELTKDQQDKIKRGLKNIEEGKILDHEVVNQEVEEKIAGL